MLSCFRISIVECFVDGMQTCNWKFKMSREKKRRKKRDEQESMISVKGMKRTFTTLLGGGSGSDNGSPKWARW